MSMFTVQLSPEVSLTVNASDADILRHPAVQKVLAAKQSEIDDLRYELSKVQSTVAAFQRHPRVSRDVVDEVCGHRMNGGHLESFVGGTWVRE